MKKIIKLTESDLQRIVERVIKEQEMEEGLGDALGRLFSGTIKQLPQIHEIPYAVKNAISKVTKKGLSKINIGKKTVDFFEKHEGAFKGAEDKLDSLISNEMGKFSKRFDVSSGNSPLQELKRQFEKIGNEYFKNSRVGDKLYLDRFIKDSWELKNGLAKAKLNYRDLDNAGQFNNIENVVNKFTGEIEQGLTKKYSR